MLAKVTTQAREGIETEEITIQMLTQFT